MLNSVKMKDLLSTLAVLLVIKSEATVTGLEQHVSPLAGEVVVLPCSTNSSTGLEWWYQLVGKDQRPERIYSRGTFHNGFGERFTVETAMTGNYNLLINGVRVNDSGQYTCRNEADDDNINIASIRLTVFDESLSGPEMETKSAFVGDIVQLACETENSQDVVWYYRSSPDSRHVKIADGQTLINGYQDRCTVDKTQDESHHILVILVVNKNDTGVYTCVHDAGHGKHTSIRLNVFRTNAEDPKREKACFAGDSVVLPCKPSVVSATSWWYQKSPDAQRRQVSLRGRLNTNYADRFVIDTGLPSDHSIRIRKTHANDDGLYTCVEDVGLGNARTTSVKLVVKDRTDNDRPSYKRPTEKATQEQTEPKVETIMTGWNIVVLVMVITMFIAFIVAFCCARNVAEMRLNSGRDFVCMCCSWNNSPNAEADIELHSRNLMHNGNSVDLSKDTGTEA